ncbi:MAG TPA: metallophosphoesterase [Candidatus Hydrogenedentes bacterium]|nr:metallophosphoesterase [Candidatus Hydrogenedentota bacterium]HQE84448.1 metallophosphoesterase [Candidatus Hydrogenedentota bacterium]HQH50979.1 metallophosphoesterase [Candidatus Hydrogenedentota bacterium]HQM51343.1 metallophosphoesterase [Candidatus Hydrogenedentota bacterium]
MWRFIQLSDPHLGSQVHNTRNGRIESVLIPELISCLRRDLSELQPDFLIVTGDIARPDSRDAVFAARDLMDSLGFPYYPMGGSSDFCYEQSRQWFTEAFGAHLPESRTWYSFTQGEIHICVLDAWWLWDDGTVMPFSQRGNSTPRWIVPPDQLEWLDGDLAEHDEEATIIAMHPPLILPQMKLARDSALQRGALENAGLLLDRLKAHAQVKLLLSGSAHAHYIAKQEGLTQVVTGSLTQYPVEFRDIHIHEDRFEVHTRGLSNAVYASQSLLREREWTRGRDEDRFAVIPL